MSTSSDEQQGEIHEGLAHNTNSSFNSTQAKDMELLFLDFEAGNERGNLEPVSFPSGVGSTVNDASNKHSFVSDADEHFTRSDLKREKPTENISAEIAPSLSLLGRVQPSSGRVFRGDSPAVGSAFKDFQLSEPASTNRGRNSRPVNMAGVSRLSKRRHDFEADDHPASSVLGRTVLTRGQATRRVMVRRRSNVPKAPQRAKLAHNHRASQPPVSTSCADWLSHPWRAFRDSVFPSMTSCFAVGAGSHVSRRGVSSTGGLSSGIRSDKSVLLTAVSVLVKPYEKTVDLHKSVPGGAESYKRRDFSSKATVGFRKTVDLEEGLKSSVAIKRGPSTPLLVSGQPPKNKARFKSFSRQTMAPVKVWESVITVPLPRFEERRVESSVLFDGKRRYRSMVCFQPTLKATHFSSTLVVYGRNSTRKRHISTVFYQPRLRPRQFSETEFIMAKDVSRRFSTSLDYHIDECWKWFKTCMNFKAKTITIISPTTATTNGASTVTTTTTTSTTTTTTTDTNALHDISKATRALSLRGSDDDSDCDDVDCSVMPGASQVLIPPCKFGSDKLQEWRFRVMLRKKRQDINMNDVDIGVSSF